MWNRGYINDLADIKISSGHGTQGGLTKAMAGKLGLKPGTPVTYRGGDQPNNALSLNVLNPGEIAATAGTSGVVYGVSDQATFDPRSRVNIFLHVNNTDTAPRLGVLLCINGTGILNSWTRQLLGNPAYDEMNQLARSVPVGSEGLSVLPFGNGAERVLGNLNPGAHFGGIDFNRHSSAHICRAVQEGIVFSFKYGMDVMSKTGIHPSVIRAGFANMFMSDVFCETLAGVSGATIELYDTDGALGAARGAGIGAGIYADAASAFAGLKTTRTIEPDTSQKSAYQHAYQDWFAVLQNQLT